MSLPAAPPAPVAHRPPSKWRFVAFAIVGLAAPVLALVAGLAVFLQVSGLRSYVERSQSMEPSVEAGDRFLVDTHAYAPGRSPGRGDIIVFRVPASAAPFAGTEDGRTIYIKRIVGVPADTVAMVNGFPVVNGIVLTREDHGESRMGMRTVRRYTESMPGGPSYQMILTPRGPSQRDLKQLTVPGGSYFVLGDNRDNSIDSRHGMTRAQPWFVGAEDIVGRATTVYWSGLDRLDRIGLTLK